MTWYKVDDSFHSHPKATATSLAALGLWVVAGSWSGNHLTDGYVPDHVARLLARGSGELADELVSAGLWKRTKGGYQFHDWDRYQPTKAGVLREREAAADRQRRRRGNKPSSEPVPERVTRELTAVSRRDTAVSHGEVRVGSGYVSSEGESSVVGCVTSAEADATRDDVERICQHLADRVASNGSKRPTVGKTWRREARLLLDQDGRTEEQIHRAIDWCQDHPFWRANVMSVPKLRERYDQMRLQAQRPPGGSNGDGYRSQTDANIAAFLAPVTNHLRALPEAAS